MARPIPHIAASLRRLADELDPHGRTFRDPIADAIVDGLVISTAGVIADHIASVLGPPPPVWKERQPVSQAVSAPLTPSGQCGSIRQDG
jgi:hypothetical protein